MLLQNSNAKSHVTHTVINHDLRGEKWEARDTFTIAASMLYLLVLVDEYALAGASLVLFVLVLSKALVPQLVDLVVPPYSCSYRDLVYMYGLGR